MFIAIVCISVKQYLHYKYYVYINKICLYISVILGYNVSKKFPPNSEGEGDNKNISRGTFPCGTLLKSSLENKTNCGSTQMFQQIHPKSPLETSLS